MKFIQTILFIGLLANGVFNGPTLLKPSDQAANQQQSVQIDQGVKGQNEQPIQKNNQDRELQGEPVVPLKKLSNSTAKLPTNKSRRVVIRRRLVRSPTIKHRIVRRVQPRNAPPHKLILNHVAPIRRRIIIHHRAAAAHKPVIRMRRRMDDSQLITQTQSHNSGIVSYDLFKSNSEVQNAIVNPPPPPNQTEIAIKQTLSSTGSNPSVIVINQVPNSPTHIAANQFLPNRTSAPLPLSQKPQVLTFAQVDTLVSVAGSIGNIVDELYAIIPQEGKAQTEEGDEMNLNSFLENTGKAILFYKRVREFVLFSYQRRHDLLDELQFLKDNVVLFKISQTDMLRFYGLDDEYFAAKTKCQPYEDKDPKFKYYWGEIADRTHDYEYSVNTVTIETKRLEAVILSLIKQFDALSQNKYNNSLINSLDKIDSVLMIFARIAEIKESVAESVNGLQTNLINLKNYRKNVAEDITNVGELAEYYRMNGGVVLPKADTSGVAILCFRIWAALGTLLVIL